MVWDHSSMSLLQRLVLFWADTEMQHPNNKNSKNDLMYFVFILFTAILMSQQS